ncbi:MAG: hypothetical protein GC150_06630 [Rhizobiales bacterium]|nr:hypothetical protein [Hyphomicrobiales bacterium]
MERETHAAPGPSAGVIDLWGAVKRNRVRLGVAVLLAGVGTYGILTQVTPLYLSTSLISVAADDAGNAAVLAVAARAREPETQAAVIAALSDAQRRALDPAMHAPRRLDPLVGRFTGGPREYVGGALEEPERLRIALTRGLVVKASAANGSLRIGFLGRDPQLAADVANAVSSVLAASGTSAGRPNSAAAAVVTAASNSPEIAALELEIRGLESQIARAESDLVAATSVREQAGAALERASAPAPTATAPRLRGTGQEPATTAEIEAARAASREMSERIKRLAVMLQDGTAETSPEVLRSPVVRRLIAQRLAAEEKVSELAATLLSRHPRMQQANAELEGVRRQIREEIRGLQRAMESELAGLVARQKVLEEEARLTPPPSAPRAEAGVGTRGAATGAAGDEDPGGRLAMMDAEIALKKRGLAALGEQLAILEARLTGLRAAALGGDDVANPSVAGATASDGGRVVIVNRADPAASSVLPRKAAWSLLAMALTLLIGLGVVLLTIVRGGGRAARRMRRGLTVASGGPESGERGEPAQPRPAAGGLRAAAQGPVVSRDEMAAPDDAEGAKRVFAATGKEPTGGERTTQLDDFACVVGQVDRLASEGPGLRVMVSAYERAADGASEAVGLAVACARSGRQSLVVGWGSAGEVLARRLGVSAAPGIHEILEGTIGFEEALCVDPRSGLFILVMGGSANGRPAAYPRDQIEMLFDALDESFDTITILAGQDSGRRLLEALDGRIDAGVVVVDERRRGGRAVEAGFLGYDVADLPVFRVAAGSGRALVPSVERELMAS